MTKITLEKKYEYADAYKIALEVLELIRPHCLRAEIAGSLRRKRKQIGDIEIVATPKPYESGLFENGLASVVNKWPKVRGEMQYGKTRYTQRILPEGIKLDLFMADEQNWGLIFAIRTGSADFSHLVLARNWCWQGYESKGGYLYKYGRKVEVREEKDLFELIKVRYVEPEHRDTPNR